MSDQSIMSQWLARKFLNKKFKETHIVIRPCDEDPMIDFMESRQRGLYVLERRRLYWNDQVDEYLLKTYKAPYLLAQITVQKKLETNLN